MFHQDMPSWAGLRGITEPPSATEGSVSLIFHQATPSWAGLCGVTECPSATEWSVTKLGWVMQGN